MILVISGCWGCVTAHSETTLYSLGRVAPIQMLQHEIPGILPVNPEGGKVARAAAVSPLVEAGNVHLPHPDYAPWVGDFIEECAAFPNGAHDDQVDAMTHALLRWNMVASEQVIYLSNRVQISPL